MTDIRRASPVSPEHGTSDLEKPQVGVTRLSSSTRALLRCPCCRAALVDGSDALVCANPACSKTFPVLNGRPVLINEERSLFDIGDFVALRETTFRSSDRALKDTFRDLFPKIGHNMKATRNFALLSKLLLEVTSRPRVLVVGGGVIGKGMQAIADNPAIELIETDLALAPRTSIICDGHDLPFADGSFDGVIIQAVLEHVVDPHRCVAEVHRVLKDDSLVYGETPFMQQVHMGPYDFTRFTHSGHRLLFRHFAEVTSGASCGPGMALAWAWQYFLLSFARRPLSRALLRGLASVTAFPLKYFDYFLLDRPGAIDAASGVYFLGRRSAKPTPDRAIVRSYRGAM